jgi:probable O-glycosylation ligase (exosortase A-associated)
MLALGYACVPVALIDAYAGLLAYCWLTFMRPQSLVWAQNVQAASIIKFVVVALLLRVLVTPGPKIRLRGPTIAFLILWFWFALSAMQNLDLTQETLEQFSKISVAVLLITGLVRTRKQLKWLIVLLAWCPGFYAAKLGLYFTRGAGALSWGGGPMGMDANDNAMFMSMAIPMLVFGACEVRNKYARWAMFATAGLAVPAVILTGSRGGMIAMAVALAVTVFLKTNLWKAVVSGGLVVVVVMAIIPAPTRQRYETVGTYEEDTSAMGRIRAWKTCKRMADDYPILGVGFGQPAYLAKYKAYREDETEIARAAHSVWFSLLAETGYVGLAIYIGLVVTVIVSCRRVMSNAPPGRLRRKDPMWNYAAAVMGAVVTFAVGGTFLSQARFEYVYALYMTVVPIMILSESRTPREAPAVAGTSAPVDPATLRTLEGQRA